MSYPGALAPPPGVVPNLDNPRDVLRTCNYVAQGLTMGIVSMFIAMWCYAKMKILRVSAKDWHSDGPFSFAQHFVHMYDDDPNPCSDPSSDHVVQLCLIAWCIAACFTSIFGAGLNQWEVSPNKILDFYKTSYTLIALYCPLLLSVKLALLILIIEVFGSTHHKVYNLIRAFIALLILYYTTVFFVGIFLCWPISAFWLGEMDKCINIDTLFTFDATVSTITDLIILLLPLPLTWSLQLPRRKRLRIASLLGAGGIAAAFSIYRLVLTLRTRNSENETIVLVKNTMAISAEVGIGLICACFPAVNALLMKRGDDSYYGESTLIQYAGNMNITKPRSSHHDRVRPETPVELQVLASEAPNQ
ncbi:hypothetical protein BGZ63DRAFT_415235 [Mariannaea sp. PMI_226]|nr:hypothetical protein BGZ63DRAFT_415235 [Mariannaea sp. PMI_226]